jgi:hypothetical protein
VGARTKHLSGDPITARLWREITNPNGQIPKKDIGADAPKLKNKIKLRIRAYEHISS